MTTQGILVLNSLRACTSDLDGGLGPADLIKLVTGEEPFTQHLLAGHSVLHVLSHFLLRLRDLAYDGDEETGSDR